MVYLHKSADTRADIRNFLPTARSVIVTGHLYYTESGGDRSMRHRALCLGRGLSLVLAERLEALVAWMREQQTRTVRRRDLRRQASRAGARLCHARGTRLDREEHVPHQPGSRLVAVPGGRCDQPRPRDRHSRADQCGACTLCLDSCPTGALVELVRARRDALHFVPDDRAPWRDPRAPAREHSASSSTGVTSARTCVPWNLAPLAHTGRRVATARAAGPTATSGCSSGSERDQQLHALVDREAR